MKYYQVIYFNDPNNFDIVKVREKTPALILTEVLASSRDEQKFKAFSNAVWNSDRVKPVDPRLFPTLLAPNMSEEFRNIIKEM